MAFSSVFIDVSTVNAAATPGSSTLTSAVEKRRLARLQAAKKKPISRRAISTGRPRIASTSQTSIRTQTSELSSIRRALLHAVNDERAKVGLPELTYNKQLEQSGQAHAEDMNKREYFAHENPEGEQSIDRIRKTGYLTIDLTNCNCRRYKATVGENIARGQDTVTKVMKDWMESPDHKANILSPEFKEIGFGIAGEYWVQNFGGVAFTQ